MEENESVSCEHQRTSTPLPAVAVPHLNDPGEHVQEEPKAREIPEFVVRLGTSLARSEMESQYKLLQKEFKTNPVQISPEGETKRKRKTLSSGTGSIRSSGRGSPMRRRSSAISISSESQMSLLSRGLGRFYRRRRMSSRALLQIPTPPSPAEENVFREPPLDRFRKAARIVRIVSGIWLWMKRYVLKPDTSQWSFVEMYIHLRDDLNQILTFNVNTYGKYEPLRDKLKDLLSIRKERRSMQNIQVIMALMRDNSSFQDYPVHTQIQLARCMEYQHYEARRVILKQGHSPSMFYIMLTGTAIVNILDSNPATGERFVRTVHTLNAGDTFGEIALLEGCVRTASIICKTACEFLVVHKEDFDVIIKEPLRVQRLQHIQFCKSLPIFKDFPCEVFAHNPSQFFYQYFREGDVIVKDSQTSKYIIVVKAGKCYVVSDFKEKKTVNQLDVLHMFKPEFEHAFPEYTTLKKIDASARRPKTDVKNNIADSLQIGVNGTIDKRKLAEFLAKNGTQQHSDEESESRNHRGMYESCDHTGPEMETVSQESQRNVRHVQSAVTQRRIQDDVKRAQSSIPRMSYIPRQTGRKTSPTTKTSYAKISELQSGQIFGLESLLSRPSTQLSLVSESAECILISKALFLKEANIKVLRIVSDFVQGFPSHDYIKDQAQSFRRWVQYKHDVERETLVGILRKHKAWVGGIPATKCIDCSLK